ncbi:MAG: hypothetical protein ACYTFA_04055 [Planctomycetota bacterium]|jgi:hypothetical protein
MRTAYGSPRWRGVLCVAVAILPLTGCAVANRDNTVLLNALDKKVRPKATWERVALAPLMIPTATGALLVDGFIIHPARVIPDAADDVYEFYWEPRDETLLRRSLLFVPRVVLTPPTFLGAWYIRSTYDVSDH